MKQEQFDRLCESLFSVLKSGEHLSLDLIGEESQFIRLNRALIRQIGTVQDASLNLLYVLAPQGAEGEKRSAEATLPLSRNMETDQKTALEALQSLRRDVTSLPPDPYALLPENRGKIEQINEGRLLAPEESVEKLLPLLQGLDLSGIYASGAMTRATANSAGQKQWYYAENFSFDYSLYTPTEKAVKSTYSSREWNEKSLAADLEHSRQILSFMDLPPRKLPKGSYRTYLGPAAVGDLIAMFSWGAIGEQAIRQGHSPLRLMRSNERTLSPKFTLMEDFTLGAAPRFNHEGDIAPESLTLIEGGKLVNSLVHARTAREYGIASNGASEHEGLRSPSVAPGTLKRDEILARLGTGLYVSNLHYLNWSDPFQGRVTGMTRYACLWVENGKIQGPVESLRWDDSLFRIFGNELEELTDFRALLPETSTYENRQLGAMAVPGALLRKMEYTL